MIEEANRDRLQEVFEGVAFLHRDFLLGCRIVVDPTIPDDELVIEDGERVIRVTSNNVVTLLTNESTTVAGDKNSPVDDGDAAS
jgi:hypothetical protein